MVACIVTSDPQSSVSKTRVSDLLSDNKTFVLDKLLLLSRHQARVLIDAWQQYDGAVNEGTGERRLYTNRPDHAGVAELLAVKAGYSVNVPRIAPRSLNLNPGISIVLSEPEPAKVVRPEGNRPGLILAPNSSSEVWCVTVPSGIIVVRRNGFSMLCGNCCEALVRRMAFPEALSGIYAREEMMQSDDAPVMQPAVPAHVSQQPVVSVQPALTASSTSPAAPPQVPAPQIQQGPVVQPPVVAAPQVADPNPAINTATNRRRRTSAAPPAPDPTVPSVPAVPDKFVCADTGQPIVDYTNEQGKYTRDWLYEYSVRTYGRALCAERLMALKTAADAAKAAAAPPEATPQQVLASQAASILNGPVNGVAGA